MTTAFRQETSVAADATLWDVGGYRLRQSTEPGVLLYSRRALRFAADSRGRPLATITRSLEQGGGRPVVTGGAASLGFLGVEPDEPAALLSLQDSWTRVVRDSGYEVRGASAGEGADPRYLPLPLRDPVLSAEVDPAQAEVVSGPSPTVLRLDLTPAGAEAWAAAAGAGAPVSGTVRLAYSYPRFLPRATAVLRLHGVRVFEELRAALGVTPDGAPSGTQAELRAAWQGLTRTGAVEVSLSGGGTVEGGAAGGEGSDGAGGVAGADGSRGAVGADGTNGPGGGTGGLLGALVEQAFQSLLETMFVPLPAAGAGPPAYALLWTRARDMPDLPLSVSVEGQTWLTETLEAGVGELLSALGPGAVHDVYPDVSVPVTVTVEGCEAVSSVAVSLDFGDARAPEAFAFDRAGGRRAVTVTTGQPGLLSVRHRTRAVFRDPAWPVVTDEGVLTAAGPDLVVAPSAWRRELRLHAFVVEDGRVADGAWGRGDLLVADLRWTHPALPDMITRSAGLVPGSAPLLVAFPAPPSAAPGRLTVGAKGSADGRVLTGSGEVPPGDGDVFLLLERGAVRVVTDPSALPAGPLAERLRTAAGRSPVRQEEGRVAEDRRGADVSFGVVLVPQPTTVSAWAAAMAMVLAARDRVPQRPAEVAARAGIPLGTAPAWPRIRAAAAGRGLSEERGRRTRPAQWAELLRARGPVWIAREAMPSHAAVVCGITGDGTPHGTWVRLCSPWPPGVGSEGTKTFREFDEEFGLATSGAVLVHG
ncbi:papain-like cysteine protease family protein [Streptomyces zhihengii]